MDNEYENVNLIGETWIKDLKTGVTIYGAWSYELNRWVPNENQTQGN